MSELALITLTPREAATAEAVFERMFPSDTQSPGATDIGVVAYLDRALAGADRALRETYRTGFAAVDADARRRFGAPFAQILPDQQDTVLRLISAGQAPDWQGPDQIPFFATLRAHLQEGLFADPIHGGNRDKLGWRILGHPGVWLENSAEENLTSEPVTKNGKIQSLADLPRFNAITAGDGLDAGNPRSLGGARFDGPVDVLLVGVGGVGAFIAPRLAAAGLRVVGLEAGPYWRLEDFRPDELESAYYCRGGMGQKFLSEIPQWRPTDHDPTRELTFSLGKMMNGVGGSVIHYGAWLRRFHPHHFRLRSHITERFGVGAIPDGCTVADWPVSYAELEPYYCQAEAISGVAADDQNPFIQRSQPAPLPPMRPFRLGEAFTEATRSLGLHPHAVPAGMFSGVGGQDRNSAYTAWNNGFGSWNGDKWQPGLTSIPDALATGNLELRTHCRVSRVLARPDGRVHGVEYVDASGARRVQEAATVILSAYTFENLRLMLLSGDDRHPDGLGNSAGQLGRNYMTKMFAHVDGLVPDRVFNRHTGPAAQGVVVDDFLAAEFDSRKHGFIGGATLGAENQFLPIQISRESLPPDVPRWGAGYKAHLRQWQHQAVVRIQPDALPYESNFIDLDPTHRDKSGLGLPVLRVTYSLKPNERALATWMEVRSEEILRLMGAVKTWRGPGFTGAGSSHDLGVCRMGDDPAASVVDRNSEVHDTPGLYVLGGAVFPSCPGINPTLTIWAMSLLAADRLIDRLKRGEAR